MDKEGDDQKQVIRPHDGGSGEEARDEHEVVEAVELVLFHVKECYVYLIPPRKTAASYRADEWNVNKWHWEGALKVVSKGEECIIRLEDNKTGELFARAFLRTGEPHPVEPVIDSSRYFVLRVEENLGGRLRHAFIGIGFRERPDAYDFQAALHDHMKYLNKKHAAEEMEQRFLESSSVDYSLKEGETLVLQINNKGSSRPKSTLFQRLSSLSLDEKPITKEGMICIKPPPPPPPLSPVSPVDKSSANSPTSNFGPDAQGSPMATTPQAAADDDFGDFQVA